MKSALSSESPYEGGHRRMTPSLSDAIIRGLQTHVADERYRLIEPIGRGGMGVVYRAEDTVLGREVALKVIDSGLPDEARITARLEHPGIVPVHDAGVLPDGRPFYAMKLVRGQRLDQWMQSEPSLAARMSVFTRICEPVAFAHAHAIVHRDLKPANIMIGSFGEVLVLDWGVASQPGAGTPGFMPPEIDATPRADVFALGRIMKAMLPPEGPAPLRSIIAKATADSPGQRYSSPADIVLDVNRYLAGEPVHAHRESLLERASRVASRHKTLIALIGAYIVMRTALIIFSWRP
jgi:serine/threonine protein kinase